MINNYQWDIINVLLQCEPVLSNYNNQNKSTNQQIKTINKSAYSSQRSREIMKLLMLILIYSIRCNYTI